MFYIGEIAKSSYLKRTLLFCQWILLRFTHNKFQLNVVSQDNQNNKNWMNLRNNENT